jgi:uncharacterized protein YggE
MTDVEISVRGSHTVTLPPEQATVYASVSADGPDPGPVVQQVADTLAEVAASLQSAHDPDRGPVTHYAVEQIRTGAHRPYNQDGRQLPLVHTAVAPTVATFVDFDALTAWIGRTAGLPGMGVNGIDWALSAVRRRAVEREARQEALRDAKRRAQDYADALDLGAVAVRSVTDPGLSGPGQAKVVMARAVADPAGGQPEIGLRPADVEIEVYVEATFTVVGPA